MIRARITAPKTFRTPLGEHPCVYFSTRISERHDPHISRRWRSTLVKYQSDAPCLLDDGSGKCRLEMKHVLLDFDNGHYEEVRGNLSEKHARLLRRFNVRSKFLGTNRKFKFTEESIRDGEDVIVHGKFTEARQADGRVLAGTPREPVYISNKKIEVLLNEHAQQHALYMLVWSGLIFVVALVLAVVSLQ